MRKLRETGLAWVWISILVLILDRATKLAAQTYLWPYEPLKVFPGLKFTLAYNKGAAFSFLNHASGWQTWIFGSLAISVSITLLIWLYRIGRKPAWLAVGIALIIGGALGNLWDRIQYGEVIDFLDFYIWSSHWPVFNLADAAICLGAFMLALETFHSKK